MSKIRFADLFAGIGGFRLGIQQAAEKVGVKTECVFSSEIEKNARAIYERNFGDMPSGDITAIPADEVPDIDLLCGGFPCQAFSRAGPREGFQDERGNLFFEIARICEAKRPKIIFLENVKDILFHDKGRTFGVILCILDDLGYDVEWQCLNSQDFGVPQRRERVFIIGHLRGECTRQIFPIYPSERVYFKTDWGSSEAGEWFWGENCASTLTRNYARGVHCGGETYILTNRIVCPDDYIVYYTDSETCDVYQGEPRHDEDEPTIMCPFCDVEFWECDCLGVHSCFETGDCEHIHLRKMLPVECERLQGYPDNWTEGVIDRYRYECLGNSVTVNVIEAIAEKILTAY